MVKWKEHTRHRAIESDFGFGWKRKSGKVKRAPEKKFYVPNMKKWRENEKEEQKN